MVYCSSAVFVACLADVALSFEIASVQNVIVAGGLIGEADVDNAEHTFCKRARASSSGKIRASGSG